MPPARFRTTYWSKRGPLNRGCSNASSARRPLTRTASSALPPLRPVERVVFGDALAELLLPLDLGVELGAEEQGDVGQPEPGHEDDRARERPVDRADVGDLRQ